MQQESLESLKKSKPVMFWNVSISLKRVIWYKQVIPDLIFQDLRTGQRESGNNRERSERLYKVLGLKGSKGPMFSASSFLALSAVVRPSQLEPVHKLI